MSDHQHYPSQRRAGAPEPRRVRPVLVGALVVAGAGAAVAATVGLFYGFLWAVNPMGDEWVCSDGEAPAGQDGFYNQCFDEDAQLPKGYEWDPFGNRPMPYNCDKDGWVEVERPMPKHRGKTEEDCVREGTDLPGEWRLNDDE